MDEQQTAPSPKPNPRTVWREGIAPIAVAVMLALGVAVGLDAIRGSGADKKPERAAVTAASADGAGRYTLTVRGSGTAAVARDIQAGTEIGVPIAAPEGRRFDQIAASGDESTVKAVKKAAKKKDAAPWGDERFTDAERVFIVSDHADRTVRFHRILVDDDGAPLGMQPLESPAGALTVPGTPAQGADLAVDPDGDRIAYTTGDNRLHVVTIATGEVRSWRGSANGRVTGLSWPGDEPAFVWHGGGAKSVRQLRTLDTAAAGTNLAASKVVRTLPTGVEQAVLRSDGATVVALVEGANLTVRELPVQAGAPPVPLWQRPIARRASVSALVPVSGGVAMLVLADESVHVAPEVAEKQPKTEPVRDAAW